MVVDEKNKILCEILSQCKFETKEKQFVWKLDESVMSKHIIDER